MKHTVKHDLDVATAKRATEKAFAAYQERYAKYQPSMRWVTDSRGELGFEAKGVKLAGAVEVKPGAIELELDVPFLLRPFTGKAIEVIEREIHVWIGKAKTGEL